MGDIINLRTARKARDRADAMVQAARNRAVHGRTKTERMADTLGLARRDALLDGARLTDVAGVIDPADGT